MSDDTDHTLDQLLAAFRSGAPEPEALSGTLDMDTAYAIQVRLLNRLRNAGARHTGWKIGQTNAAMRRERGETQPAPGNAGESLPRFKLYEHVAGALLTGEALPGASVEVRLGVTTDQGRHFEWSARTSASRSGRWRQRVPYANRGASSTDRDSR